jgi:hypothetical protein
LEYGSDKFKTIISQQENSFGCNSRAVHFLSKSEKKISLQYEQHSHLKKPDKSVIVTELEKLLLPAIHAFTGCDTTSKFRTKPAALKNVKILLTFLLGLVQH